jgi:hypothetical protein
MWGAKPRGSNRRGKSSLFELLTKDVSHWVRSIVRCRNIRWSHTLLVHCLASHPQSKDIAIYPFNNISARVILYVLPCT